MLRFWLATVTVCGAALCPAGDAHAAEPPGAAARAELTIDAGQAALHTEGAALPGGGWNLWSNGRVGQPVRIAAPGVYEIVIRAWGSPAGGVWPEMAVLVDGRAVRTVTVDRGQPEDYRCQAQLSAGAQEIAAAFLNDAVIGQEDRNLYLARLTLRAPPGAAAPVTVDQSELAQAAEERQRQIVAATSAGIEKNRKADARIRVVDAAGRPVPGVTVGVEQVRHEFLFGGNLYMFDRFRSPEQNATYKQRFQDLFNYATLGFYWIAYERQRGQPDYAYTDRAVAWCREHAIRMKGHPLLWGDKAGIPPWSQGQPSDEIQRRRVEDILTRYRGRIEFWEVVNEPAHQPLPKIDEPYRWARQADPAGHLIVNDYHVLADGCPQFFDLLTAAQQHAVPFDGIGIQAHEPRGMRFQLDRVQEILDHYATLGKALHITEFTPTSDGQKITGAQRQGVWDEAAQADYAVKFYQVCFAHPAVRAITWWDLCDQGAWLPGGGMLRADLSPKPVYDALKHLIHDEWRTRASGTTDAEGRFAFRGFCGEYRVTLTRPEGALERTMHLGRAPAEELRITLPAPRHEP